MGQATSIVKEIYAAFGRRDVAGILAHCADKVDWEFVGSKKLGYARTPSDTYTVFERCGAGPLNEGIERW